MAKGYFKESRELKTLDTMSAEIICYRGKKEYPRWVDLEPGAFRFFSTLIVPGVDCSVRRMLHYAVYNLRGHVAGVQDPADGQGRHPLRAGVRHRPDVWSDGAAGADPVGRGCEYCRRVMGHGLLTARLFEGPGDAVSS